MGSPEALLLDVAQRGPHVLADPDGKLGEKFNQKIRSPELEEDRTTAERNEKGFDFLREQVMKGVVFKVEPDNRLNGLNGFTVGHGSFGEFFRKLQEISQSRKISVQIQNGGIFKVITGSRSPEIILTPVLKPQDLAPESVTTPDVIPSEVLAHANKLEAGSVLQKLEDLINNHSEFSVHPLNGDGKVTNIQDFNRVINLLRDVTEQEIRDTDLRLTPYLYCSEDSDHPGVYHVRVITYSTETHKITYPKQIGKRLIRLSFEPVVKAVPERPSIPAPGSLLERYTAQTRKIFEGNDFGKRIVEYLNAGEELTVVVNNFDGEVRRITVSSPEELFQAFVQYLGEFPGKVIDSDKIYTLYNDHPFNLFPSEKGLEIAPAYIYEGNPQGSTEGFRNFNDIRFEVLLPGQNVVPQAEVVTETIDQEESEESVLPNGDIDTEDLVAGELPAMDGFVDTEESIEEAEIPAEAERVTEFSLTLSPLLLQEFCRKNYPNMWDEFQTERLADIYNLEDGSFPDDEVEVDFKFNDDEGWIVIIDEDEYLAKNLEGVSLWITLLSVAVNEGKISNTTVLSNGTESETEPAKMPDNSWKFKGNQYLQHLIEKITKDKSAMIVTLPDGTQRYIYIEGGYDELQEVVSEITGVAFEGITKRQSYFQVNERYAKEGTYFISVEPKKDKKRNWMTLRIISADIVAKRAEIIERTLFDDKKVNSEGVQDYVAAIIDMQIRHLRAGKTTALSLLDVINSLQHKYDNFPKVNSSFILAQLWDIPSSVLSKLNAKSASDLTHELWEATQQHLDSIAVGELQKATDQDFVKLIYSPISAREINVNVDSRTAFMGLINLRADPEAVKTLQYNVALYEAVVGVFVGDDQVEGFEDAETLQLLADYVGNETEYFNAFWEKYKEKLILESAKELRTLLNPFLVGKINGQTIVDDDVKITNALTSLKNATNTNKAYRLNYNSIESEANKRAKEIVAMQIGNLAEKIKAAVKKFIADRGSKDAQKVNTLSQSELTRILKLMVARIEAFEKNHLQVFEKIQEAEERSSVEEDYAKLAAEVGLSLAIYTNLRNQGGTHDMIKSVVSKLS